MHDVTTQGLSHGKRNRYKGHTDMRVVVLEHVGYELLIFKPKGAKRGETKWDKMQVVEPASESILLMLTLLNRCYSTGSVSPTIAGG